MWSKLRNGDWSSVNNSICKLYTKVLQQNFTTATSPIATYGTTFIFPKFKTSLTNILQHFSVALSSTVIICKMFIGLSDSSKSSSYLVISLSSLSSLDLSIFSSASIFSIHTDWAACILLLWIPISRWTPQIHWCYRACPRPTHCALRVQPEPLPHLPLSSCAVANTFLAFLRNRPCGYLHHCLYERSLTPCAYAPHLCAASFFRAIPRHRLVDFSSTHLRDFV